jgi:hypothetical protein
MSTPGLLLGCSSMPGEHRVADSSPGTTLALRAPSPSCIRWSVRFDVGEGTPGHGASWAFITDHFVLASTSGHLTRRLCERKRAREGAVGGYSSGMEPT